MEPVAGQPVSSSGDPTSNVSGENEMFGYKAPERSGDTAGEHRGRVGSSLLPIC